MNESKGLSQLLNVAFRNGQLNAFRSCREELEKLGESHPDINVNADNAWVKLSVAIAAIRALEEK